MNIVNNSTKLAEGLDFDRLIRAATNSTFNASTTISDLIKRALPLIYSVAGITLLIYLLIGGYGYLVSQGDPQAIASAKSKITTALIGIVIVFISYWIVQLAGILLGIDAFTNIFNS